MIVLGIETSCDETSVALVEDGVKVVLQKTATSILDHQKTGGIVPEVASRKQVLYMIPVLESVLSGKIPDCIAVTESPGLIGSLVVGTHTAQALSLAWEKPLYFINHIMGHIYSLWLDKETPPEFPFITLVVSGGHTDIYLAKSHAEYTLLGSTKDDAVGECFDKVARILDLGYPGGPAIDKAVCEFNKQNPSVKNENSFKLPKPLISQDSLDFSFSGLKTSVFKIVKNENPQGSQKETLIYEFQETAVDILVSKMEKACLAYNIKKVAIVGGVSANSRLRQKAQDKFGMENVYLPHMKYTGDNGAMVGSACYFQKIKNFC